MVIKKIYKLFSKDRETFLKNKTSVISRVGANSTLTGRRKVESLKKIGKNKRR